ncbi:MULTISPECIES: metallophosphoesterase [unclassified Oceanispirochaeta]|uniref:metallophosphoesterase family protein n=1 Tax=unclassified Oceanispirochaeta TaxID=2635722 RepID=UPI00131463D2|nr:MULTISPECIES: metallophosphoesterase [unclassified Oceanispirochaeta]MBF9017071.1 metallophosphoesterase family protein [Oceanispirochaeta sp. M2]NPD73520.1 hypothetical protein [Oceanispirochaeta sp. M1]
MKIAHITDLHLDERSILQDSCDIPEDLSTLLGKFNELSVDEIIITGDMGDPESVHRLFGILKERKLKYRYIMGNHDDFRDYDSFGDFPKREGGRAYSSSLKNGNLFLSLDSSMSSLDPCQCSWIQKHLEKGGFRRVFVIIHHPVLDCGNTEMDREYSLKNRDEISRILMKQKKEVFILCGHYHFVHDQKVCNLTQMVSPPMSIQTNRNGISSESDCRTSFRIIEISEGTILTQVFPGTNNPKQIT